MDKTPKAQATKAKINKWEYVKLKNYTEKEKIYKLSIDPHLLLYYHHLNTGL